MVSYCTPVLDDISLESGLGMVKHGFQTMLILFLKRDTYPYEMDNRRSLSNLDGTVVVDDIIIEFMESREDPNHIPSGEDAWPDPVTDEIDEEEEVEIPLPNMRVPPLEENDEPYPDSWIGEMNMDAGYMNTMVPDVDGENVPPLVSVGVGQRLTSKDTLQMYLKDYYIRRHVQFKVLKSGPVVHSVRYTGDQCPWYVYASFSKKCRVWKVRRCNDEHTCLNAEVRMDNQLCTSRVICNLIMPNVMTNFTLFSYEIIQLVKDREAITNALVEFYAGLYTTEPGPRHSMDGMPIASLSPDKAMWLEAHFSLEKIEAAVKTLPMDKAPGPDGFNGEFFRASWEFMKTDFIDMLNDFYHMGIVFKSLGASLISLLPKKEGVENIRDFRPISLISGPYKIVARILAGRLKTVLPDLISKEQNDFISSHQILDAAMVTHEVADRFGKAEQPQIILKLDMEKAFDRVDWDFLEAMMRQMSFGERWIGWIRSCVENASFSLLVNGGVFGRFGSLQGLRQGDPLSPLLFNIMGEGLTSLVKATLEVGWLTNVLPEALIPLSQFADDTIIFGEGSLDQVEKWKAVITLFELGSGQKVNWSKTEVFGFNMDNEVLQHFAATLGCSVGTLPSTCLGLLLFHSRISKSLWCPVIEKVQKRLSIWKGKMLSKAGRLILIRACLSGIPMHYYALPSSVVKELERLYRNFLWKGATEDFKYHLVNWRKVCLPKSKGGLGIHRIALVNKAFMLKWCWRLNMDRWASWSQLVTFNFGVDGDTWWAVGNGQHTLFWRDMWLGSAPLRIRHPSLYRVAASPDATVLDTLGSNQSHSTDWASVFRRALREDEVVALSSLESLIGSFYKDDGRLDSLIWSPSMDGSFTVASAYSVLLPSSDAHVSRRAWQLSAPPKVQFFNWSALHGKILTRDVLARRGQQLNSLFCPLCDTWMETTNHLLLHCEYTWKIWTWFVEQFNCSWVVPNSLASLLTASPPPHLSTMGLLMWRCLAAFLPWAIWGERNRRVFQTKSKQWEEVAHSVQSFVIQWLIVQGKLRDSEVAKPAWRVITSTRIFHPPSPPATWIPPPAGTIKVNFDGSSLGNPGPAGYGGVFRKSEGEILMSFAGPIGIEDSTSAEVYGVLHALRHFQNRFSGPLLIEGDSSNVIGWCKQTSAPPWRFLYIFREISFLTSSFVYEWHCTPRSANSLADSLAKEGTQLSAPITREVRAKWKEQEKTEERRKDEKTKERKRRREDKGEREDKKTEERKRRREDGGEKEKTKRWRRKREDGRLREREDKTLGDKRRF
ncbi:hypothetical protein H6P81_009591 [Aristolochia fimbriata]|uniref:Reverse transcriptase domain-containing protein n=1 Tax=Aristolochia fimbriata TaxID=158543 RepID=A0AAV7EPJ2_ARIFI|nr:hypothetical protein H6P81_009591 [Aristolochia fimbriata]